MNFDRPPVFKKIENKPGDTGVGGGASSSPLESSALSNANPEVVKTGAQPILSPVVLAAMQHHPEMVGLSREIEDAEETVKKAESRDDEYLEAWLAQKRIKLTPVQYRQEEKDALEELMNSKRKLEENLTAHYRELSEQAHSVAAKYIGTIQPKDQSISDPRGQQVLTNLLSRTAPFQTYDELANWMQVRQQFWAGSPLEVADRFENVAANMVERPEDFDIQNSQLGKTIHGLPKDIQRTIFAILVNEGGVSIGGELKLLANRIRDNANLAPKDIYSVRAAEVRNKDNNTNTRDQSLMRLLAIQEVLQSIYPESKVAN